MTAAIKNRAAKYIPDYEYTPDQWSTSKEEAAEIFAQANECMNRGDIDAYFELIKKIPLAPNIALSMRDEMGKEELLAEGYNLADAEIVYGKDWIDNYKIDADQTFTRKFDTAKVNL